MKKTPMKVNLDHIIAFVPTLKLNGLAAQVNRTMVDEVRALTKDA